MKANAAVQALLDAANLHLLNQGQEPFPGDGVDYLISVYKDPRMPIPLRVQCACAAAVYERPRLSAVAMMTKDLDAGADPAGFGKLFAEFERRLSLHGPEKRVELIEALREPEELAKE